MKKLYLELSSLEHMGTTIWFEGVPSNSKEVTEELSVTEENSYVSAIRTGRHTIYFYHLCPPVL